MTLTGRQIATKLKEVENFVLNFETLTPDQKKVQTTDGLLMKRLKEGYKPLMVDQETQTELTYHDIDRMEENEKKLLEFLKIDNPKNPIKDENRKKDCLFRMQIVERGIASIEEDMEHSKTQGQEMKRKLEELESEVRLGKITDTELEKKVYDLEQLVKRKESEYQKSLKIKDEEWGKLRADMDKLSKTYTENNKILASTLKDHEKLGIELGEKDN